MTCDAIPGAERDLRPGAALLPSAILQPPIGRTDGAAKCQTRQSSAPRRTAASAASLPNGIADGNRGAASAVTAANAVAKPLDKARPMRTAVECPSSTRTATDGPGPCGHSHGSEGWGFESLRAPARSGPFDPAAAVFLLTDLLVRRQGLDPLRQPSSHARISPRQGVCDREPLSAPHNCQVSHLAGKAPLFG